MGELDAVAHDGAQALVASDRTDEGAIELHLVAGHGVQVAQRGVAGAEVVDEDVDAGGTQRVQGVDGRAVLAGEHALGDFEADGVVGEPAGVDRGQQFVGELRPGELARGQVHAHPQRRALGKLPCPVAQVGAHLGEHVHADVVDQVQGLGERDELGGRQQAERRVRPAHQRLEALRLPRFEVDDGLVEHRQAAGLERRAQLGLDLQHAHRLGVHLGMEELDRRGLAAARLVQGVVGVTQQGLRVFAVVVAERHPDPAARMQHLLGGAGREGRQRDEVFTHAQGFDRSVHTVEQHGELVAADTRAHVALTHERRNMRCDPAQQLVAHGVAVAVVDQAEALQVDREHRELAQVAAPALGQRAVGVLDEHRAVGQAGEAVVQRVVHELLLGALAQVDVAQRPRHAEGVQVLVAAGDAAHQHPARLAVGQADAELHHELRAVALQVADQARPVGRDLVRMDVAEERFRRARHRPGRHAQDLAEAVGVIHGAGAQVPVPQAVVGAVQGHRMALLARLQAFGGVLQFVDALLQGGGHDVEVAGDHGQLVFTLCADTMVEPAVGDRLAALEQAAQVAGQEVADGRQQEEGERDLGDRDREPLLHDRASRRGQHRHRDTELEQADLVLRQQQGPAHVHHFPGADDAGEEALAVLARLGQVRHEGQAGRHQHLVAAAGDAHVHQAFFGLGEQFAEDVLQGVEALLFAIGGGHGVEHARVLGDGGVQARRHGVVHQPHAVGEQQAQQHDLHHRAREQEADADRGVAKGQQHGSGRAARRRGWRQRRARRRTVEEAAIRPSVAKSSRLASMWSGSYR